MTSSQNDNVREEDFRVNLTSYHYQIDLLLLFLWRGYKNEYMFELEIESKDAEKFDDLVFSYHLDGKKYANYLQAKYKKDPTWEYKDFAGESNITVANLKKYFTSFRKIKQKFENEFAENFILCSNIVFESLKLKKYGSAEDDVLEFVEIMESDTKIFTNGKKVLKDMFFGFQNTGLWKIYRIEKINSEIHEKLLKITNLSILAEELANCIINHRKTVETNAVEMNMENFWFSRYHKALENENIIEKNQEVVTFSSWFMNEKRVKADEIVMEDNKDLKFDMLDFRKMFQEEYKNMTSMPMDNVVFNKVVANHYIAKLKNKSNKLKIDTKDSLHKLCTSLVKHSLESSGELDEILKNNFDIILKVLTKTERIAFTKKFADGQEVAGKVEEFRKLLLYFIEKQLIKKLESQVFVTTHKFYEVFQNEQALMNNVTENTAEKISECILFQKKLSHEIISSDNVTYINNIFRIDETSATMKTNFLQNQNLKDNIASFRTKFFEFHITQMLYLKRINFTFNVKEVDNVVNFISNSVEGKTFDEINYEKGTENLIKAMNGFVFEKVVDESNKLKFTDSFLSNDDQVEDIKLLKATLKKKLSLKNLSALKDLRIQIPEYHSSLTSFDENENMEDEINDFCQKFVVITSPDEKGIIQCVKSELENKYDSRVAESALHKLNERIVDFAKSQVDRLLTYEETDRFFEDIVTRTEVDEMAVITSQYCAKLKVTK